MATIAFFNNKGGVGETVLRPLPPLLEGDGGIKDPELVTMDNVSLLPGDLGLSGFEDELSQEWPSCLDGKKRAFRVIGGFHEVLARATRAHAADVTLVDVGPNLGAINRAALISADHVVIPLAQEAHKPMFKLKPADGAIGGHVHAVQACHNDFRALARSIAHHTSIDMSKASS